MIVLNKINFVTGILFVLFSTVSVAAQKCPSDAKNKCRAEADRRWAESGKAWCVRRGENVCQQHILDGAAMCLNACGDTRAFDRLPRVGTGKSGSGTAQ